MNEPDLRPDAAAVVAAAGALLGSDLQLVRVLDGGTHATTLLVREGERELVARGFPEGDDAVAHEVEVLLRVAPLADLVPVLVAADPGETGGLPLLVTTPVSGGHPDPGLAPRQMAERLGSVLARVHALDGSGLREVGDDGPRVLSHGDFWCGNAMWESDRLTGLVDWSGAVLAHPGMDLSWCRQDLVLLGDPSAAEVLLEAYRAAGGVALEDVAGWDRRALEWADRVVELWAPNYAGIGRPEITAEVLRERLDVWGAGLSA